jgi:hypothetical protein
MGNQLRGMGSHPTSPKDRRLLEDVLVGAMDGSRRATWSNWVKEQSMGVDGGRHS